MKRSTKKLIRKAIVFRAKWKRGECRSVRGLQAVLFRSWRKKIQS